LPIGVASTKNTLTGYVQDDHVNDFDFRLQYNEFSKRGVAANPTQAAGTFVVSQFASQTGASAHLKSNDLANISY